MAGENYAGPDQVTPGQVKLKWIKKEFFTQTLWPGNAYMCKLTGSALVQEMTGCMFSSNPLCEPMLMSVKFNLKHKHFL